MSVAGESGNETVPGTVFSPRQVRILKVAVIVMGVLLVGGFAFVLAAIVYQASHSAQKTSVPARVGEGARDIDLPMAAGTKISAMALDGDRLAVHLDGASGEEVAIIDLATGKLIARVKLKPQ